MAIFNLFDKDKEQKANPQGHFGPANPPLRGPGGKFVSKNKPEIITEDKSVTKTLAPKPEVKKITKSPKFKGPFPITFYGKGVKRFYEDGKWYFAIEDILNLCSATPGLEPYAKLKESKKYSTLFKKHTVEIESVACVGPEGANEILVALAHSAGATFPGPLTSWFTETANLPYEEPVEPNNK